MVNELTDDNLAEVLAAHDTVLVQYSAGWCGNCRIMKPKFKKMAADNTNAYFVLVDAEKNPGLSKLPKKVRNKMGYMKEGGKTKT